jgi:hypothetical protein
MLLSCIIHHQLISPPRQFVIVNLSQCFVSLHSSRQQHNSCQLWLSPEDVQSDVSREQLLSTTILVTYHILLDYYEYYIRVLTWCRNWESNSGFLELVVTHSGSRALPVLYSSSLHFFHALWLIIYKRRSEAGCNPG